MHLHPMRFENFNGRLHYEDEYVLVEKFHGKIGRTVFDVDASYYLGEDPAIRKRDNHLHLDANYIDFDQLFSFNLEAEDSPKKQSEKATTEDVPEHTEAFNIYELPFTDMEIDVDRDRDTNRNKD